MRAVNSPVLITFIWTISLVAVLIWIRWIPVFEAEKYIPQLTIQKSFQNISYDSKSNDYNSMLLAAGPKRQIYSLDLILHFKLYELYPCMDLFQTGYGFDSIRFTTEEGPLNSLVGVVYVGNYNLNKIYRVIVTDHLQKDKNYSLKITEDYWENIYIYFDDQLINVFHNVVPIVSNIVIANGFEGRRPFFGMITVKKLDLITSKNLPIYSTDENIINRKIKHLVRGYPIFLLMGLIALGINLAASYQLMRYLLKIDHKI